MRKGSCPKIIVIGLDGATWNIIKPLINKGKLPTIGKFLREGTTGNLESSIPHVTFPAWKCYSTGKNPGKLGVYWWLGVDINAKRIKVNNSLSFKSKEIWDYISYLGISVGIIGMPTTYPPKEVNGFMISEFNLPNSEFTYPRNLKQELKSRVDYDEEFIDYHGGNPDVVLEYNIQLIKQRFKAAHYLIEMYNPSFLNLTIFHIDAIQHFYWRYMANNDYKYGASIEHAWAVIDQNIKDLVEKYGKNSNIFLMSDHGFTSLAAVFNMNKWLMNNNYLLVKKERSLRSLIYKAACRLGIKGSFAQKLKKIPFLKNKLQTSNFTLADSLECLIDWENSKIIPVGEGLLYINNLNMSENYSKFRNKVIKEVENIRNPINGEPLAKKVYKREAIYRGEYLNSAPDIIVLPNEGYEIKSSFVGDMWEFDPKEGGWSGIHKLHGIFLAYGPDIKKGVEIKDAKIYDIAPTILHLFGLPVPDDMDGRVLKEIFKEESEPAQREVKYQAVDVEREKVKDRIRKLKKSGKL